MPVLGSLWAVVLVLMVRHIPYVLIRSVLRIPCVLCLNPLLLVRLHVAIAVRLAPLAVQALRARNQRFSLHHLLLLLIHLVRLLLNLLVHYAPNLVAFPSFHRAPVNKSTLTEGKVMMQFPYLLQQ